MTDHPSHHNDLERFEALVRRHASELQRFVRLRVGRTAADDVVQLVWLEAWERRDRRVPDRLELFAIARHRASVHHAARRRGPRAVQFDALEIKAFGASVGDIVESREHAVAIRAAIAALSVRDQEVFHLAAVMGFRHAEIRDLLGMPTTNAASKAVAAAKARFRAAWVERRA